MWIDSTGGVETRKKGLGVADNKTVMGKGIGKKKASDLEKTKSYL